MSNMQQFLLSGEFDHTVDPKGRVTLPARYREHFQRGTVLVRFPGKAPCISVFDPDSWREFDAKNIEPLDFFEDEDAEERVREIYANQDVVEPDRQGRVLLPSLRMKELGLSGKVKIIGVRTHLEIWDPDTFEAHKAKRAQRRAENA